VLLIWTEKTRPVEMDHVRGVGRNPNLRFPGDVAEKASHRCSVGERGDKDQAGLGGPEQLDQLVVALGIDGTM